MARTRNRLSPGGLGGEDDSLEPLGATRDRSLTQDEAEGQAGGQGWRQEGLVLALTAAAPEADPSPRLRLEGPGVRFAFTTPTWGSVTCHHSSDRLSDTEKPKKPRAKRDTPATPPQDVTPGDFTAETGRVWHGPGAKPAVTAITVL